MLHFNQTRKLASIFNRYQVRVTKNLQAESEFSIFNFASSRPSASSEISTEFVLSSSNFYRVWLSLNLNQLFARSSSGTFVFRLQARLPIREKRHCDTRQNFFAPSLFHFPVHRSRKNL